ncbi:MAG: DEAD/DEAH box helicase [Defluviitaleaceae bacterium]|nr:DEAD/DEAH box helicase [Defluviitaleaceae bacterium]
MEQHIDYTDIFTAPTLEWFRAALGEPTEVQREAWPAIASGRDALICAPTGTGKTLSAFLVFIDRMKAQARDGTLGEGLLLVYISPLKSLAGDIRENLYRPLNGIASEAGDTALTVAIRTGDTPAADRARMAKKPPHILITTPESLYLLLTSVSGRRMLSTAKAVIVDELHAVLDTKRGAHLMLSLARLDVLCGYALQRIGLSATIRPTELAARYLSNNERPVEVIAPKMRKDFRIEIVNPFPGGILPEGTVWPEIAKKVAEACKGTRSVIAFTEGRLMTEQLAYYVQKLEGEDFARTHHGSVSKEQRFEVENALRGGKLRLLCATSSMELGIDVGEIDRVLQVACPVSVSGLMQRLGRAGHNPGRVSLMSMYPRMVSENLYCALTAQTAREGGIEHAAPPRICLDVLAQHLVSMSVASAYRVDDVMALLPRAYPFREVTRDDVCGVLNMLAGDYEHERDVPVRPRLCYDRINGTVQGDAYSRMLATSAPGTIPDTGKFTARAESGVKIGELDEEFVFEQRIGFKFLLGAFAWRITDISKDTVTVAPATHEGARPPFWRVQSSFGRRVETGLAFGRHMRALTQAAHEDRLTPALEALGLDEQAAADTADFVARQIERTKLLPSDQVLLAEHFVDEVGLHQVMIHSVYGRQVNAPLAVLLALTAKNITGMDVDCYDDDDGVLIMARGERPLPEGLLNRLRPETCRALLESALPGTPLFNITFRHNAGRALMMGVRSNKRNPLWVQRLRASEMLDSAVHHPGHPLMRETTRECLEDYWNLPALETLLADIGTGRVQVREMYSDEPSPMCLPLRRAAEAMMMYSYSPSTDNVLSSAQSAAMDVLREAELGLQPSANQLERVSERGKLPEDEQALHTLLMIEGDTVAGELPLAHEWFESLAKAGRCAYIEPGLWIAAEHASAYEAALAEGDGEARANIVRRALRYRGAMDAASLAQRYFWPPDVALGVLNDLCAQGSVIADNGVFHHAELYERARRATITERRQVRTVPGFHYAALMASRLVRLAPPAEQLRHAVESVLDTPFPADRWEAQILPARVAAYRADMQDKLLASGEVFWSMRGGELAFHAYADVDWDADTAELANGHELDADEQALMRFLRRRGASFVTAFAAGGDSHTIERPMQDVLFSLMQQGLIHADSFTPVRLWIEKDAREKQSPRRRAAGRAAAVSSGRWDIVRPRKPLSIEAQLDRAFDRVSVLCRETASSLLNTSWAQALEVLRLWEYTGRARRGYFVEGLSGAQYIREDHYAEAIRRLALPDDGILWLAATDPCQMWGKALPDDPDRRFANLPGTAVALRCGTPVAVFERKGHTLRFFDTAAAQAALTSFAETFRAGRIFPAAKRVTVKQYPPETAEALTHAGFERVMLDYVLYR